jgi:hypothetical protein
MIFCSTKLEKEKKQQAKESGLQRSEVAPQEVREKALNYQLMHALIHNAIQWTLFKLFSDSGRNGERKTIFSITDVRGNITE